MASSRRSRVLLSRLAVLVIVTVALPAPGLASEEDDLRAAQQRANKAADELSEAEEELARAEDAVANLETRVARIDARVGLARDQVRQLAVRLYVQGTANLTRLLRTGDANELVRAQQYSLVVAGTSTDSLQQYRADREDLRTEMKALAGKRESQTASLENLRQREADAIEEIDRLSRLVAESRAAQAAAQAAQTTQAPAPPGTETPAAPGGEAPSSVRSTAGSVDAESPASSPRSTLSTPSSVPAAAQAPAPSVARADWICPVQGPHAFSNDYGAPRGGGATHKGNDILASRGAPVVASVDGVVTHRSGAVSGLAYYLAGVDGNTYFGAHLDSFGASGRVTAGTVVGTVGNTGDAAGGPTHLHFEIQPGGTGNINPYTTLTRYC